VQLDAIAVIDCRVVKNARELRIPQNPGRLVIALGDGLTPLTQCARFRMLDSSDRTDL
jgi:hypothetical protein